MKHFDYRLYLKDELVKRQRTNPRYSLRAFAASLSVDPGLLSKLLSGKRNLSVSLAGIIATGLGLSDSESQLFLDAAVAESQSRISKKIVAKSSNDSPSLKVTEIDSDAYATISEMHHYAILEATHLAGFRADPKWISKNLGITTLETEYALARLLRLGLLTKKDGHLQKTGQHITIRDKSLTSPAQKESQRQILKGALHALETESIERRSMTGMTMTLDPAKIPLAKQLIQDFMENLCSVMESGERKEVFQLGISLFSWQGRLNP